MTMALKNVTYIRYNAIHKTFAVCIAIYLFACSLMLDVWAGILSLRRGDVIERKSREGIRSARDRKHHACSNTPFSSTDKKFHFSKSFVIRILSLPSPQIRRLNRLVEFDNNPVCDTYEVNKGKLLNTWHTKFSTGSEKNYLNGNQAMNSVVIYSSLIN